MIKRRGWSLLAWNYGLVRWPDTKRGTHLSPHRAESGQGRHTGSGCVSGVSPLLALVKAWECGLRPGHREGIVGLLAVP